MRGKKRVRYANTARFGQVTTHSNSEGADVPSWAQAGRAASLESEVFVPTMQAIVVGFFIGLAIGVAWFFIVGGAPVVALAASFTAGSVAMAAAYILILIDTRRLLWVLEEWLDDDLDDDGRVGKPENVRIEVTYRDEEGNFEKMQFLDVPLEIGLIRRFAGLVLDGRPLSQGVWTGSGGLFSRSEYDQLMAELEARGMVTFKNPAAPAQGRVLTRGGKVFFEQLAKSEYSPTL